MAGSSFAASPGTRVRMGKSVLTAAKSVNTRPVQARLEAFGRAHHAYAAAQGKVEEAEAALAAAQAKVVERDRAQDEAVESLARALIAEGQSRDKPFAGCNGPTPAALMHMPPAQEAQQIHVLVTALQRNPGLSKATREALDAADKAARAVEKALAPIEALQEALRQARRSRDALAPTWDKDLAALRRGARAAIDDGEPYLHATLFQSVPRNGSRNGKNKHASDNPPAPTPPTPPAPSTTN